MPSKKNDMDDLHDARHGPLFMLYLKKLDWTAGRKVQVRHGRHDMEGLRLNTCCCQLCHGNHEWMKGLAEALEVNTAWSSRPQPNVSSSHGFNDKFGLGWLPFRTPSVSCHSARLNIGSTLQRSAKVTWHCTVALHCLLAFQCASLSVSNGPHHTWKRLRLGQFLCVK